MHIKNFVNIKLFLFLKASFSSYLSLGEFALYGIDTDPAIKSIFRLYSQTSRAKGRTEKSAFQPVGEVKGAPSASRS